MRFMKMAIAAIVMATPCLVASAPAEALTSNQYMHQGRGHYTNSSGTRVMRPKMRHRGHHRLRSHRRHG